MIEYLLCIATGLLAKLADRSRSKPAAVLAGFLYGLGGGFLATRSQAFATVAYGLVAGELAAGKVDKLGHYAAVFAFIAAVAFLGFVQPSYTVLAALVLLAFADEFLHDKGAKAKGVLGLVAGHRLLSDLGALLLSVFTGEWVYFAAVACFDLGYQGFELVESRLRVRK